MAPAVAAHTKRVVLLASTSSSWADKTTRDQKVKAEVQKLRADTRASQIASTEITADEGAPAGRRRRRSAARVHCHRRDAGGVLGDEEKPLTEAPPTPPPKPRGLRRPR